MAEFTVNNATQLSTAIADANSNSEADIITLGGNIQLTEALPFINDAQGVTIEGNGFSISGDVDSNGSDEGDVRIFSVGGGIVAFNNLTLTGGRAEGGSLNGGGGAGLGGALFIFDGDVTVANTTFVDNTAVGGNGGTGTGTGGGIGLGSDENGATIVDGTDGAAGTLAAPNGEAGGTGGFGGQGGIGGSGASPTGAPAGTGGEGGAGGFGGGGGFGGFPGNGPIGGDGGDGGDGGFGGGGGDGNFGGVIGGNGGNGGLGGYGGGGGQAGFGIATPGSTGSNGTGGTGGFGAGAGDINSSGGGAGLGGAVFVRSGSLALNNVSFENNTTTGGTGAEDGQGLGGAVFVLDNTQSQYEAAGFTNSQGLPSALPTVDLNRVTFTGSDAADGSGNVPAGIISGSFNNDDIFGAVTGVIGDPLVVGLSATGAVEGNSGSFVVTRSDSFGTLSVVLSYTNTVTNGIAELDTDYTFGSGATVDTNAGTVTVTIPNGQTSIEVDIDAIDDDILVDTEANETFSLALVESVDYSIDDANNGGTVTIFNNDFSISEGATTVGATIGTVPTALTGSSRTYAVIGGDPSGIFDVDSSTGLITVAQALDFEDIATGADLLAGTTQLDLAVQITDESGTSTETVSINILDVSESPEITNADSLNFTVSENVSDGTFVGSVQATDDEDTATNTPLTFRIIDTTVPFRIDGTGAIVVDLEASEVLSAEDDAQFGFDVEVEDSDGNITSERVNVSVLDENEPPVIDEGTGLVFDVEEDRGTGFLVGQIPVDDEDIGQSLDFEIIGGDPAGVFSISDSGALTVSGNVELDAEAQQTFTLQVQVTDSGDPPLSDSATVVVNVQNVNESPIFTTPTFDFTVDENTPADTFVGVVSATDPENNGLSYTIESGNIGNAFAIDNNGQLTVNTGADIDFDTLNFYALTVQVTDDGSPSQFADTTVNITVNGINEPPVIVGADANGILPTINIAENRSNNSSVGTPIQAVDEEGDTITFAIVTGNENGAFAIDSSTGQITVADNSLLDFETPTLNEYQLTIEATDSGDPTATATAFLTIIVDDVNEPPIFPEEPITLTIDENSADGTAVGDPVVAVNEDTGQTLDYSIIGGNFSNVFAIDGIGQITVNNSALLDFESRPSYTLTLRVQDVGGTSAGATDTVQVTVNVNDVNEPPTLDPVGNLSVEENAPNGTSVVTLSAIDPDTNDPPNFAITGGTGVGVFAIDATSGEITVADSEALDFETQTEFQLDILLTDSGSPVSQITETITIAVNDDNEAPVFLDAPGGDPLPDGESFSVDLPETAVNGDPVIALEAIDGDVGDVVSYSITSGNNGAFAIDANGNITVNNDGQIDFDTTPSFTLIVQAQDNNGSQSEFDTVQVDVNITNENRAPVIDPVGALSVEENAPNGTTIDTITVTDPDANDVSTFSILGGTGVGVFDIDATTGEITVIDSSALDFETTTDFTLDIRATDSGTPAQSAEQTLTITVTDENEFPVFLDEPGGSPLADDVPLIAPDLIETALNGDAVFTVAAEDGDGPADTISYRIVGGNNGGAFAIDSVSGAITVADEDQIDIDTNPNFSLTVEAQDTQGQTDSVVVEIALENANEPPVFDPVGTLSVEENAANGTLVGDPLTVTDPDNGDVVTFSILAGGTGVGIFDIDATTGQITVIDSSALDAEGAITQFTLDILAIDDGVPPQDAEQTITIDVTNVEEAPTFLTAPGGSVLADDVSLTAPAVSEAALNGDTVFTVEAIDGDGGPVAYRIIEGNNTGAFAIDANTGVITVNDPEQLNFDTTPSFSLRVEAEDTQGFTDLVVVDIAVDDANRPPVIDTLTPFFVAEDAPANTVVGTISVTDPDASDTISFSFLSGNDDGVFAITPNGDDTATITVVDSTALDFETNGQVLLEVRAADDGNPLGEDIETVTVNVTNAEEPPQFLDAPNGNPLPEGESLTATALDETAADNTFVITVEAEDGDGDNVTYSIVDGNNNGAFAIQTNNGQGTIIVADTSLINADDIDPDSITLTVQAQDGSPAALTSQIDVIVPINDVNQPPVLTVPATAFEIPENSPAGTVVGTIAATNADVGETLTYEISSELVPGVFDLIVNDATGEADIVVVDSAALDFEAFAATDPDFELGITVTDNGPGLLSDTATVSINLTDANEAPVFLDGQNGAPLADNATLAVTISEDLGLSDPPFFQVFATDDDVSDQGLIRFAIASGNTDNVFAIDDETGELSINNATSLDFDLNNSFTLGLVVADDDGANSLSDTVDLIVTVTDVNELPVLEDVTFSIDENSADTTLVGTVTATDADDTELTYSITGGNTGGAFAINAATGEITVADGSQLDHETTETFMLDITVNDGQAVDPATVTININDVNEAPALIVTPPVLASVSEAAVGGDTVVDVSTSFSDPDDLDTLSFSILSGDGQGAFTITPAGEIVVADASQIDREAISSYDLVVQATDSGNESVTVAVSVDVTDVNESPTVEDLTLNISEDVTNGFVLATSVVASDPENDTLTYSITGGNDFNGNPVFAIGANTGQLTVVNSDGLDHESPALSTYDLTVQVTDGTTPATATVTVIVDDANEQPVIQNTTFEIAENTPNNVIIGNLDAFDPDDGDVLTYTLLGGDPSGVFAIDPSTGNLSVANSTLLDAEVQPTFTLTVQVADDDTEAPLDDVRQVTVTVLDSDEPPVVSDFNFNVLENSGNGSFVGIVAATDPEGAGLTYAIDPQTDLNGVFSIDADDGTILVNNGALLDAETNDTFVLSVDVSDGTNTSASSVTITIEDDNEAPTFPSDPVSFTVREDAADETIVGTVTATDVDAGQVLRYDIIGGDPDGAFRINNQGIIRVDNAAAIDFEANPSFTLTVEARDDGTPVQTGTNQVTIAIENINELPVIEDAVFDIDEQSANNTVVGIVSASDPDGDDLAFSIIDGDDGNIFVIDPNTGVITVPDGSALDFAESSVFFLTVEATDNGTNPATLNDTATIQVNVNNLNDPPEFVDETSAPTTTYTFDPISEATAVGTQVGQVQAVDPDEDALSFNITAGNDAGFFTIDSTTGDITVASDLSTGSGGAFALTVEVTDSVTGTTPDTATVNITVNNINQPPVITEDPNSAGFFFVTMDANNGLVRFGGATPVDSILAEDPDGDALTYEVVGGTGQGIFDFASPTSPNLIADPNALDPEFPGRFSLTVQVTDTSNATSQPFTFQNILVTSQPQLPDLVVFGDDANSNIQIGTSANELFFGDDDNEQLIGRQGDDELSGGGGNDSITAGRGNDRLFGDGGDDELFGVFDNDVLYGRGGNDFIDGGDDDDFLFGNAGNDRLLGGAGTDVLEGGIGNDTLEGGEGDDTLIGISDVDGSLLGVGEIDRFFGGPGADTIIIGDENGTYYDDNNILTIGTQDYAQIESLQVTDRIQVAGSVSDYTLSDGFTVGALSGVGILLGGELIALAVDRTADDIQSNNLLVAV